MSAFPILKVVLDDATHRHLPFTEAMGSKRKFWLVNTKTHQRVMLKFARPGSGEDWSEKLAYEIGREIGVPCPRVDLAVVDQQHATLCWDFLGNREGPGEPVQHSLVHGNELLSRVDPSYPAVETYRVSQHTVEAVHNVLQRYQSPLGLSLFSDVSSDAFDAFVGYLMLDALIGNTDRHHENWGVIVARKGGVSVYRLAPSYDHASSLGRELRDEKRRTRLQPSGRGTVADYADKAVSAFWDQAGQYKLSPIGALARAAELRPVAFRRWQGRLTAVDLDGLVDKVAWIPDERLSVLGRQFTHELLRYNYGRIAQLNS